MQDQTTDPRELSAYHEAGHAVIANCLDLRVASVTIDGFGRGSCRHEPCGPYPELLICLAGLEAEARVLGFETWCVGFTDAEIVQRACGDLMRAHELATAHPDLWPRSLADVRRLLATDSVWAEVVALAGDLLEHEAA